MSSQILRRLVLFCFLSLSVLRTSAGQPLKVAYSDWPGWVAWEVAVQKNFFKDAGVEVEFLWFEYGPSMEAFTAGKVDAVMVTNGDALVTGANGAKNVMILLTDYSNGNDMIVAMPGVGSVSDLKGKKADESDAPGARLRSGARNCGVAAQLRTGAQSGGGFKGDLYERR
jgi:NitT/TauT family transport system substrate-binding protein